jgi:hypothetical protein
VRALHVIDDAHSKRRLKVIDATSASQVSAFAETCNRYWFFQSVEGCRDDEEDKPPHLTRGTHIDELVERRLLLGHIVPRAPTVTVKLPQDDGTKKLRTEDWSELIDEVLKHLPDPATKRLTLQHWGRVAAYESGPVCVVKPDVMHCPTPKTLRIDDLKTTSDFKYCKSAAELAQNIQLNTYARYGYEELGAEGVTIGHAYARTKWDYKANRPAPARAHRSLKPHGADKGLRGDEPCACAECKAWLSSANRGLPLPDGAIQLSREHVDNFWQTRVVPQVKLMVEAARTVKDAAELPPSTEKCSKIYGQPCPFRAKCGFDEMTNTIFGGGTAMSTQTNGTGGMTLAQRLEAASKARAAAAVPTKEVAQPQKEVERVVNEGESNGGQMVSIPNKDGGATVGGGGAPDKGVDGYKPGQGCNGRGYYASANGQGFAPVEANHVHGPNCPGVIPIGEQPAGAPGYTAPEEGAGMHVLPPEVRNQRESTPEQVAAVEAGKRGRGRPKKVAEPAAIKINAECQFCDGSFPVEKIDAHRETFHSKELQAAEDAAVAKRKAQEAAEEEVRQAQIKAAEENAKHAKFAEEHLSVRVPVNTATASVIPFVDDVRAAPPSVKVTLDAGYARKMGEADAALASDAQRADAQAQIDATLAKARTGERKQPPAPVTIYVDCHPRKGRPAVAGDDWLAPIMELAALANVDRDGKSAPMEDFRLIPYTADGVLAVAIRACLDSCPARLALRSESRAHKIALEVLTPYAVEIVS